MTAPIDELLASRSVIVCVGTGGVGKTSTSAALALRAARAGRRVCVITIDPARRLADSLRTDASAEIGNEPTRLAHDGPGELWAVMLDSRTTFRELILTHAPSPERADAIFENQLFANIADGLSGTHEYMAMEKLHQLHHDERFDLVIVDTPPVTNAVDFLEAPDRITRFLDHRLYRILVSPSGGLARAVNFAAQAFLRTISRVVGARVVDDVIDFLAQFDGMEQGFRDRAESVHRLLRAADTSFLLVSIPRDDVNAEAAGFVTTLADAGIAVDAVIVNRVHPRFAEPDTDVDALIASLSGTPLAPHALALARAEALADDDDAHIAALVHALPDARITTVPLFDADLHDLDGIERLADALG